jgi:hypothetical protein
LNERRLREYASVFQVLRNLKLRSLERLLDVSRKMYWRDLHGMRVLQTFSYCFCGGTRGQQKVYVYICGIVGKGVSVVLW